MSAPSRTACWKASKKAGIPNARVEGMPHCDWVLIDAGDVIVHVFRPEVRAFYNLEKMWASADAQPADELRANRPCGWWSPRSAG